MSAMNKDEKLLREGHYAVKQIFSKSRVVAFSHRSRFDAARDLVRPWAGTRLLDYGSGDGSFIAMVLDLFPDAVGVDIEPGQVETCRARFSGRSKATFRTVKDLDEGAEPPQFDVVTCMEVLEHCVPEDLEAVVARLRRVLAPTGRLFVSVPVETGPSLILKEAVRTVSGWRRIGDYQHKEHYSPTELVRMVLARENTAIPRPVYLRGPSNPGAHGHKGFNWRALKARIERDFEVRSVCFSPFPWSRGLLSSQVFFVCTHR